jgi:hypothetical protein
MERLSGENAPQKMKASAHAKPSKLYTSLLHYAQCALEFPLYFCKWQYIPQSAGGLRIRIFWQALPK